MSNAEIDLEQVLGGGVAEQQAIVTPSVFFFVNDFFEKEVDGLREVFLNRVADKNLECLSRFISLPDTQNKTLDERWEEVDNLLAAEYWLGLFNNELINREDIPSLETLARINLYLVVRNAPRGLVNSSQINDLAKIIRQKIINRANYNLSLIIVGENEPDIGVITECKMKFKIGNVDINGIRRPDEHVEEVLINFLLSLVFSNQLLKFIEATASLSTNHLIFIGASTLLVDFHAMQHDTEKRVKKSILESLSGKHLEKEEELFLKEVVNERVNSLITQNQNVIVDCLKDIIVYKVDGDYLTDPEIELGSELDKRIRIPKKFTRDYLLDVFLQIIDKLIVLIKRNYDKEKENNNVLLSRILEGAISGETRSIMGRFNEIVLSSGLTTLQLAVKELIACLKGSRDVNYRNQSVRPIQLITKDYLSNKTQEILWEYQQGKTAVFRFFRKFLSPTGTLVYLIPIVIFIYFLLPTILSVSELLSFMIASASTLAVIGGLFLYWEIVKTKNEKFLGIRVSKELSLDEKLELNTIFSLSDVLLGIASRITRENRFLEVMRLINFEKQIYALNNYIQDQKRSLNCYFMEQANGELVNNEILVNRANSTIKLVKISYCKEKAIDVKNQLGTNHHEFISYHDYIFRTEILTGLQEQNDSQDIIARITDEIAYETGHLMNIGHVQTYVLSDQVPLLDKGQKWFFLETTAVPLGELTSQERTGKQLCYIGIGDPAALVGAYGQGSALWPKNGEVVRYALINELQCIRGVVVTR